MLNFYVDRTGVTLFVMRGDDQNELNKQKERIFDYYEFFNNI